MNHSKAVLLAFLALVALSTIWGFQSFSLLKAGGYDDPGSASGVVARTLAANFKLSQPDAVLVIDYRSSADTAANQHIAQWLSQRVAEQPGVARVASYYDLGSPKSLRSIDGRAVYTFVYYKPNVETSKVGATIQNRFDGWFHGARVYAAGSSVISHEISSNISTDIATAEMIAIPLTVVLLIFVFGSIVSSFLPFVVAGLSGLGALLGLYISASAANTSIFAVNLVTGMALGLGIDYALLIVNRFREERAAGNSVSASVETTMLTAGRTVFFSGVTVAVVMLALGFFPQYFLRSFAQAAIAVVVVAVSAALLALTALLNLIGNHIDRLKVVRGNLAPKDTGVWEKVSRTVMRRPLPILFVILIALASLASISRTSQFGLVDDRILPASNRVVVANDQIRTRFDGREGTPIDVVMRGPSQNALIDYTNRLSEIPSVVRVQSPLGITQNGLLDTGYAPAFADYVSGNLVHIQAVFSIDSHSPQAYNLIKQVRAIPTKVHYVKVGGSAASYTDSLDGIYRNLPYALGWIALATFVLLFLFTGSVLLPIKAILLNLLSLSATMGFLTWVFQDGHLHWLVGDFQTTGTLDLSTMVLVGVIAFGLSMDYELFLLSRIKEQHDLGQSTIDSVSYGLQRSGRIITAAAFVLAVSFFAFVTSSVSIMKLLGLGVAFAILLDATVIRALLVPALMRLFGEYNWWAPAWMKRIYRMAGLEH
ncbi:MAG: MMPL family transporter [Micrococcales bacterium]